MPDGGNLILGKLNSAITSTNLWKQAAPLKSGTALEVLGDSLGVRAYAPLAGIVGEADETGPVHAGVVGWGKSGILGYGTDGGSGVEGSNDVGVGVTGRSTGPFGWGNGVLGVSNDSHGVVGIGRINGVYGFANDIWGVGVVGQSNSRAQEAFGVFAWGKLGCTGVKHAAVAHPDGKHRLLYSMESPECWFEDFGSSQLRRGVGRVTLPRDFAELVRTRLRLKTGFSSIAR